MSTPDTQLRPTGPRQDDQPQVQMNHTEYEDPNEPPAAAFSEPTREPEDPDAHDSSLDGSVWFNAARGIWLASLPFLILILVFAALGSLNIRHALVPLLLVLLAPGIVMGACWWLLHRAWRTDRWAGGHEPRIVGGEEEEQSG